MQSVPQGCISRSFIITLLFLASLFLFLSVANPAQAQVGIPAAGVDLDGYAWSGTIGWVSMNCKTGGTTGNSICPGAPGPEPKSDYKVTLNSSGALTGYAWSSNIGWVRFGDLSNFPIGGGTTGFDARVTGTYPNLTLEGWARACAGDDMDASCNPVAVATTTSNSINWTPVGTSSGNWNDIVYANSTFVAVGTNGSMVSADGLSWATTLSANSWEGVAFGNGLFSTVSSLSGGGSAGVRTSTNGLAWTLRSSQVNESDGIAFGNNRFVATTDNNRVHSSADGITWNGVAGPSMTSVAFGNGMFVGVMLGGQIRTSLDGLTWTPRSAPTPAILVGTDNFNSIVYGNGKFVAVTNNRDKIITSSDGITWTAQTLPSTQTIKSVTYGDGVYVVAGISSVGTPFYGVSSDAITWTTNSFGGGTASEVGYGNGYFIAISTTGVIQRGVLAAPTYTGSGWDGWISLNGTAPSYGITMTAAGATTGSYAWGSTVVGWLDFDQVGYVGALGVVSGTNCTIPQGASTCNSSMSWNITGAASPSLRNNTTATNYSTNPAGTTTPYSIRQGANTIQVRDGSTVLASVTLTGTCVAGTDFANGSTCELTPGAAPVVTITTNKRIARVGETVGVTWTMVPSPIPSGSCALTGPGLTGPVTSNGNQTSATLRSKTRFTITCTGSFPTVSTSTQVEIIPVASEV
jgi:hypothetical protein